MNYRIAGSLNWKDLQVKSHPLALFLFILKTN